MTSVDGERPRPLVAVEASTARSSVAVSVGFLLSSMLGGLLALLIAVIVGESRDTDAFLAAYSLYLVFTLFGATLRVALVPLMGSTADEEAFRVRATDALRRLMGVALLAAAALAVLSPALGLALVPGAPRDAQTTASVSLAILALASYCQIAAAGLAAVLAAARRFPSSAMLYVLSNVVSVALAAGLMALIGIVGAAIGVLGGAIALLAGHEFYLRRFGFAARAHPAAVRRRETWRITAKAAAGAAVPIALQVNVSIGLAAVSERIGAVTAYSYAYFLTALLSSITAATIGLVTMPALVRALEERGRGAADEYLRDTGPFAILLYLPLAAGYAVFGRPILDAVLEGPLAPGTVELLWDMSRIFLAMGLAWAILAPLTTLALSLGMFRRLALLAAGIAALQAAVVIPAAWDGPVTASAAHAAVGTALVAAVLWMVFGRRAGAAALRAVRGGLPAAPLAALFPAAALAGLPGDSVAVAVVGLVVGLAAYGALAAKLWPSVGGRALRLLLTRD